MSGEGNKWFRFYREALDDPKVQRLRPDLFKAWVNILCVACETGGKLPTIDDLAFKLRISVQEAEMQVADLINAALIDIDDARRMTPHNWPVRQYASDSSAARMRKHRAAKADEIASDAVGDVTVTVQSRSRAEPDSDTELATPLPPTQSPSPRQVGQQGLKFGKGKGASEVRAHTLHRAEGYGLPVAEILAEARQGNPNSLDAYFQAICRRRLKLLLPNAHEDLLRAAFTKDAAAFTTVCGLLMMVPHDRFETASRDQGRPAMGDRPVPAVGYAGSA